MTTQTQARPKFVKYWDHETPEILATDKNEIRVYAQHGKVQVYPIVSTSTRGVGKGATINLDTFTKQELNSFQDALNDMMHQGSEGYNAEKKYWEKEEPVTLASSKNEVRFYTKHGKLQVFPKIESGRGIGRGASINFEGLDFELEAYPIFEAINDVVDSFLQGPDFEQPAPPPAPVNVMSESPKEEPKVVEQPKAVVSEQPQSPNMELIRELLKYADPSVVEQFKGLLGEQQPKVEQPKPESKVGIDYLIKKDEPKAEVKTGYVRETKDEIAEREVVTPLPVEKEIEEVDDDFVDEENDVYNDEDEAMMEDIENESKEEKVFVTNLDTVGMLDNETLKMEFEKNSNIDAKSYDPKLTVALFEEIKDRIKRGVMAY